MIWMIDEDDIINEQIPISLVNHYLLAFSIYFENEFYVTVKMEICVKI